MAMTAALPAFFGNRITLGQATEEIRRLFDTRVGRFLDLARQEIFGCSPSPYRALFKRAGCEYSDLRAHVLRDGLEPTLVTLASEGVYFTSEEFKGKVDVVRGSTVFQVSPTDFERRRKSAGMAIESSGTRNTPIGTFVPLDWRAVQARADAVFYGAHGLLSLAHAIYEPVITGRIQALLINSKLGVTTERWFALRVTAHGRAEEAYHRMNAHLVAALGRWFGVGIAGPRYVERGDIEPVASWIAQNKRVGRGCCIRTVVSNAVRLSRHAAESGLSLEGTVFHASGEPLTSVKKRIIEQTGARIAVRYGPGGGMGSALGCSHPEAVDDMHVPQALWTLVQRPTCLEHTDPPVYPLLMTTLHSAAPRLLLNVENGDCATLTTRDCECPLQQIGFTQHVHTVRSFEKLTSEGMNYFGAGLAKLLEGTLPLEFGGGPGDYQLVEEEDETGRTRVTLVVHPAVGALDEGPVLARLHEALAKNSRNDRFMATVWRDAGSFRIRREAPHASVRGKIQPLRVKH
jgi:hypothetical protein